MSENNQDAAGFEGRVAEADAYGASPVAATAETPRSFTRQEIREISFGLSKTEVMERFGRPDIADEYSPGEEYWTYYAGTLQAVDPTTMRVAASVTFKFTPDGRVFAVRY